MGLVAGLVVEDTVCLSKDNDDHCVKKFHFMDVIGQKGLDRLKTSGIVGLSPI